MAENTKKVVVDASIILAKLLPDEAARPKIKKLFSSFEKGAVDFLAPSLLRYEVANALRSAIKQKRLAKNTGVKLLEAFLRLPIIYEEINYEETLAISLGENLSFYDAAYVFLSSRKNIALKSLDQKLMEASRHPHQPPGLKTKTN
jgi:predicted nucleic acid-binding protein